MARCAVDDGRGCLLRLIEAGQAVDIHCACDNQMPGERRQPIPPENPSRARPNWMIWPHSASCRKPPLLTAAHHQPDFELSHDAGLVQFERSGF